MTLQDREANFHRLSIQHMDSRGEQKTWDIEVTWLILLVFSAGNPQILFLMSAKPYESVQNYNTITITIPGDEKRVDFHR